MDTSKKAAPKKAAPRKAAPRRKAAQQETPNQERTDPNKPEQEPRQSLGDFTKEMVGKPEQSKREHEEEQNANKELCRDCKVQAISEILNGSNAEDVRYILEEVAVLIRREQEDAIRGHQRVLRDLQSNQL